MSHVSWWNTKVIATVPQHMYIKNLHWNLFCLPCANFFIGATVTVKLSIIHEQNVVVLPAICKIVYSLHYFVVEVVALVGCGGRKDNCCAKPSLGILCFLVGGLCWTLLNTSPTLSLLLLIFCICSWELLSLFFELLHTL